MTKQPCNCKLSANYCFFFALMLVIRRRPLCVSLTDASLIHENRKTTRKTQIYIHAHTNSTLWVVFMRVACFCRVIVWVVYIVCVLAYCGWCGRRSWIGFALKWLPKNRVWCSHFFLFSIVSVYLCVFFLLFGRKFEFTWSLLVHDDGYPASSNDHDKRA